jgi:hypothetical protein
LRLGDGKSQVFLKDGNFAIFTSNGWKSGSQLPVWNDHDEAVPNAEAFAVLKGRNFQPPTAQALFFLNRVGALSKDRDAYTGYLSDDAVRQMILPSQPPSDGDRYPPVQRPTARITFWIEGGILRKFELKVIGTPGPSNFLRTITMDISNIGYTAIALPDAAISSLGVKDSGMQPSGIGKNIGLDCFYNLKAYSGGRFEHVWDDTGRFGYSGLREIFEKSGATVVKLDSAPAPDDLGHFSVYVIANPTNETDVPGLKAHYIESRAIDAIESWVRNGGVLVLLADSKGNCELEHLNQLARRFGIVFDKDRRTGSASLSQGYHNSYGGLPDHPVFNGVRRIELGEFGTLNVHDPAEELLVQTTVYPRSAVQEGHMTSETIMAISRFDKGTVFAAGSPWLTNENLDAIPPDGQPNDNRKAAENLAQWLLSISSLPRATR